MAAPPPAMEHAQDSPAQRRTLVQQQWRERQKVRAHPRKHPATRPKICTATDTALLLSMAGTAMAPKSCLCQPPVLLASAITDCFARRPKMQGLEAQVLQLQTALQASELERARETAELEVLMAHLPAASLQRGGGAVAGQNGHQKASQHTTDPGLGLRCCGSDPKMTSRVGVLQTQHCCL